MAGDDQQPLRVLFFLHAINFDRVFENLLREVLRRGHRLDVVLDTHKRRMPVGAGSVFRALRKEHPGRFSFSPRRDAPVPFAGISRRLRLGIDYLRYLEPEYAHADALRDRAQARAPRLVRALVRRRRFQTPEGRGRLNRTLRALERALPTPPDVDRMLDEHRPDVVFVAPLVGLGSAQGDYIRAAQTRGIPVVLPVASWDNLTNKGVIRDAPDLTVVWNPRQVDEAVELHRIPREQVVAAGAHAFDHWFSWSASTTADEFAEKVGLEPGGTLFLYACSSAFIARDEVVFVREWLERLRASDDEVLREARVVIRPHPQAAGPWAEAGIEEPGRVVVFPRAGAAPAEAQAKADYFDSIHHCAAMVGINTSALVEAAVVGRPVLTLLHERFRETQQGTLHWEHLAGGGGDDGVLVVARDWEQHLGQLAACARTPGLHDERLRRFLTEFVRPHGLDVPAAPRAVDAIEAAVAAHRPGTASSRGPVARALDRLVATLPERAWALGTLMPRPHRVRRTIRKRARRLAVDYPRSALVRLRVLEAPPVEPAGAAANGDGPAQSPSRAPSASARR